MVTNEFYGSKFQQIHVYTRQLRLVMSKLCNILSDEHHVHLLPEAMIKTNRMPNGLLVESPITNTFLLPYLLRDPGCGFFLYRLDVKPAVLQALTQEVMLFCQQLESRYIQKNEDELYEGLCQGLHYHQLGGQFQFTPHFEIDEEVRRLDIDTDALISDLQVITNTLELKQMTTAALGFNQNEVLGFIHTGSLLLPTLLHQYIVPHAMAYSTRHLGINSAQIKAGLVVISSDSAQYYPYLQALKIAMNFGMYKRAWIFQQLNHHLKTKFNIEAIALCDVPHAGIFFNAQHQCLYQARGVQLLETKLPYYLIAGHRESMSLLAIPPKDKSCIQRFLSHGTSYVKRPSCDYGSQIGHVESQMIRKDLTRQLTNTAIQNDDIDAFTCHVLQQQLDLEQKGFTCYRLKPLMNYQGPHLRKAL